MDGGHTFLHYLEDFDEDIGDGGVDTPHVEQLAIQHEQPAIQHEQAQTRYPQIDRSWVEGDVNNIVPGRRARNTPDYNMLAGN